MKNSHFLLNISAHITHFPVKISIETFSSDIGNQKIMNYFCEKEFNVEQFLRGTKTKYYASRINYDTLSNAIRILYRNFVPLYNEKGYLSKLFRTKQS